MNWVHACWKALGGLLAADAVDRATRLLQPGREPREVAVAGDQDEAADVAGVEQVHGVDDQARVGGVLAGRVGELLHRLDRPAVELGLPAREPRAGPVAVGAPHGGSAVLGRLVHDGAGVLGGGVVGVDQHGEGGSELVHPVILAHPPSGSGGVRATAGDRRASSQVGSPGSRPRPATAAARRRWWPARSRRPSAPSSRRRGRPGSRARRCRASRASSRSPFARRRR